MLNLYFNVTRCKVMYIGRKIIRMSIEVSLNVTRKKDLGVTFDNGFSFDVHIQSCINKANKMIGIIKRTFTFLDKENFNTPYKTLLRPYLEYGNVIWFPQMKGQSVAIERVQRRATTD